MARAESLRKAVVGSTGPDQLRALIHFLAIEVIVSHMLQSDSTYFPLIKE